MLTQTYIETPESIINYDINEINNVNNQLDTNDSTWDNFIEIYYDVDIPNDVKFDWVLDKVSDWVADRIANWMVNLLVD